MERTTWTDHRLDDFTRHVDARFDQVDKRFDQMDTRFDRLESELRGEMRALQTSLVRVGGGLMVALVGVIAALLAGG